MDGIKTDTLCYYPIDKWRWKRRRHSQRISRDESVIVAWYQENKILPHQHWPFGTQFDVTIVTTAMFYKHGSYLGDL